MSKDQRDRMHYAWLLSNSVHFVAKNRMQIARHALNKNTEFRRSGLLSAAASSPPSVLISNAKSLRPAVDARNPYTSCRYPLHCFPERDYRRDCVSSSIVVATGNRANAHMRAASVSPL
jgi:hypothetical protein